MAVLIKGQSIKGTQKSRDHYLRGSENERITVREIKGFASQAPDTALAMIALSAKGTKCTKPVYSVKLNPEMDRIWSKAEIQQAINLLEENLGLKDHPRVVVEHQKNGRTHYHVLWSRFHPYGGPAVRMSNDYAAHQKTQRQLEKMFKLRPMMTKGRDFKHSEVEWAKRYGFDIFALRKQITAGFKSVTSGQEFKASLEAQSIVLCRGDKSQFVLILPWGHHKALSSMIHGRPTKAILRRALGDIDIAKLPTVAEGKALVKATLPKAKSRTTAKSRYTLYIGGSSTQSASRQTASNYVTPHRPKMIMSPTVMAPIEPMTVAAGSASAAQQLITRYETPARGKDTQQQKFTAQQAELGGDVPPSGRADLAYKEEFDKWLGLIAATASDLTLTKDQRRAYIAALRIRQLAAAEAVRKKVREEERAIIKSARRANLQRLGIPEPRG